jgi:hypothetical protein
MNIVFQVLLNYIITFCRCANVFIKFSGCLVKEKNNDKFMLASLKTVFYSKDFPEVTSEFLFWLSSAIIH